MQEFMNWFHFQPQYALSVGIERECFITDSDGSIMPWAPRVLDHLGICDRFGYELSACQLEDRVGPCALSDAPKELQRNEADITRAEKAVGFRRLFTEVGPDNMPLDVYPDPAGRYARIVESLSQEKLLAACQVTAVHVHIGMPDHHAALKVYNNVIRFLPELCTLGDGSTGRRLEIYKIMAPQHTPRPYSTWGDYRREALARRFVNDPRQCWDLIRISVHGTIEFRIFGSTSDLAKIHMWASRCHELCQTYL